MTSPESFITDALVIDIVDACREARERKEGEFSAVVRVLREHLMAHAIPHDGEVPNPATA